LDVLHPAPSGTRSVAEASPSPGEWALIWARFKRDRMALAALFVLCAIVAVCFVVEPLLEVVLGHDGSQPLPAAVDVNLNPVGPFNWVRYTSPDGVSQRAFLLLGADGPLGRDELLRLLSGGRVSLEIALLATVIALVLGVGLGAAAGYYGGLTDAVVSRVTELLMSFPLLLLMIALGQTAAERFEGVTAYGLFPPGVLTLGVVIGVFCWFYPARLVRALVRSLKEEEFVEAARMVGASDLRIIRQHLAPHVAGPLIVWGTLVASGVIVLEASLSVLNFGVRLGTASWGNLLASNWGTLLVFNPGAAEAGASYPKPPLLMVWPALILFVTVLALAAAGDGLRSALDPKERQ
jgi:ABC-type dipeptide/oligopeptide/nickel transport system permease subunit